MTSAGPSFGILTTDVRLIVRSWDQWLAKATGIETPAATGRPLGDVVPELEERGLLGLVENVVSKGVVEILSASLHHYFIPCPPSAQSALFEQMQQHVTIGPLREEGRIVGAIVTIEDVTARVEQERQLAKRPVESLSALLGQDQWRDRRAAVMNLAANARDMVDALVDTIKLHHTNFGVLSSALDLLAMSDIDVVEQVIRLLEDEDANLRLQAALILGDRRDRRAVPALLACLDDPDINVRFHAIESLGRLQAPEAVEPLTRIAEERDFFLAFPAVQSLRRMGDASIGPRLVPLLADELLRIPVIEVLGDLGDEEVASTLVSLLNDGGAPADVVAEGLANLFERYEHWYQAGAQIADLVRREISSRGAQRILDALQQVSSDRLPGLARVLTWLDGEAAQRALTRLLGQPAIRSQVVEALVRHGKGVVSLLADHLDAEDLDTRQAAVVALGRIGDREATPALVRVLKDPELAIAAAGALARIGDADAYPALISMLGERDAAVRQSAIAALHSIGHRDMPSRVVALLGDANPVIRESALKIAGYFGYEETLDLVLDACRDEVEMVRRTAIEQLGLFEDPRVFDALSAALARDTPVVRAAAASALARIEHPSNVDVLIRGAADPDTWVRYTCVRSLGALADPRAADVVADRLLNDSAPHVRLAAIDALGHLRPPGLRDVLEPLTQSGDQDTASAAIRTLGRLGTVEILPILEDFLQSPEIWRRMMAIEALGDLHNADVAGKLQWLAAAERNPTVVQAAIGALSRVAKADGPAGAAGVRALSALTSEPQCRELAVAALSDLPSERLDDIGGGLRHVQPDVRRATVEVLSRMQRPDASRLLEVALDDAATSVRLAAIAEFKRLGTRSSRAKLMTLARTDPDASVRQAAMLAVARAEGQQPAGPPGPR